MSQRTPGGLFLPDKETLELVKRITWPQRCEEPASVPDGLSIEAGYLSPYFITDLKRFTAELDKAFVLVSEQPITKAQELVPILEKIARTERPVLVVATAIQDEAHALLAVNKLRGMLQVSAIVAKNAGSIAHFMRCKFVTAPIEAATVDDLGTALRVCSGMKSTVIVRKD